MTKTQKTTLYIGLNDKDTKTQKIDVIEAYKIVQSIILGGGADGATIYNASGFYKHADGQITIEQTLRVELFAVAEAAIRGMIGTLKQALNQESIIMQNEFVTSQFI